MKLADGIKARVIELEYTEFDPFYDFQINDGTYLVRLDTETKTFRDNAFYPKSSWRNINHAESTFLIGVPFLESKQLAQKDPENFGKNLYLFDISPKILEEFWLSDFASLLKDCKSESSRKIQKWLLYEVLNRLNSKSIHISHDSSVIAFNSPDLPSTTFDHDLGVYIGLHFDNFSFLPANQRDSAPVRVAINLGDEDRFFVYINLTTLQIYQCLEKPTTDSEFEALKIASSIANEFMHKYPNYPVVKIRLKPGQGYVAPTQNIIHDGYTAGKHEADINFMLRGTCCIK